MSIVRRASSDQQVIQHDFYTRVYESVGPDGDDYRNGRRLPHCSLCGTRTFGHRHPILNGRKDHSVPKCKYINGRLVCPKGYGLPERIDSYGRPIREGEGTATQRIGSRQVAGYLTPEPTPVRQTQQYALPSASATHGQIRWGSAGDDAESTVKTSSKAKTSPLDFAPFRRKDSPPPTPVSLPQLPKFTFAQPSRLEPIVTEPESPSSLSSLGGSLPPSPPTTHKVFKADYDTYETPTRKRRAFDALYVQSSVSALPTPPPTAPRVKHEAPTYDQVAASETLQRNVRRTADSLQEDKNGVIIEELKSDSSRIQSTHSSRVPSPSPPPLSSSVASTDTSTSDGSPEPAVSSVDSQEGTVTKESAAPSKVIVPLPATSPLVHACQAVAIGQLRSRLAKFTLYFAVCLLSALAVPGVMSVITIGVWDWVLHIAYLMYFGEQEDDADSDIPDNATRKTDLPGAWTQTAGDAPEPSDHNAVVRGDHEVGRDIRLANSALWDSIVYNPWVD